MTPFYSNRIDQIDRLLPQTQCTQCGYPRCRDYAAAIDANEADINQCPPGAQITIQALATFTGKPPKPLNPSHGAVEPKMVALIDESACIGCKLCLQACPVDCIIGANKRMHTVIAGECTGCKLCVPVCPTDCIRLMPAPLPDPATAPSLWPAFSQDQIDQARRKTAQKLSRDRAGTKWPKANSAAHSRQTLQQEIQAALVRKSRSRRKGSLSRTSGTDR